jgi:hypothetical protein
MSESFRRKPALVNAIQWDGTGSSAAKVATWAVAHEGYVSNHASCCQRLILSLPEGGTDYIHKGGWVVQDGTHFDTFTAEEFTPRFEKVEFQAELGNASGVTDIAGFDLSWCSSVANRNLINELIGLEAVSTDNMTDGASWMFKPYPISTLGKLITAIIDAAPTERLIAGPPFKFLEVGCGIGAKMLMVNKIFGMAVRGFDYNEQYCNDAMALLDSRDCTDWLVERRDAFEANDRYREADIIYLNRPFVHLEKEAELEMQVFAAMKPGAYIILANYATEAKRFNEATWRKIAADNVALVMQLRG